MGIFASFSADFRVCQENVMDYVLQCIKQGVCIIFVYFQVKGGWSLEFDRYSKFKE